MCLGIPGEVVALMAEHEDLAMVRVAGAERPVNIGMLRGDGEPDLVPGDWVLIHVGFAMSRIDEATANASLEFVTGRDGRFAD